MNTFLEWNIGTPLLQASFTNCSNNPEQYNEPIHSNYFHSTFCMHGEGMVFQHMVLIVLVTHTFQRQGGAHAIVPITTHKAATLLGTVALTDVPAG